jgi:hypothetical protein
MRFTLLIFALMVITSFSSLELLSNTGKMDKAREKYYLAIEDEDHLQPAIDLFEDIKQNNKNNKAIATIYIGSLNMLKGKYAFWPMKKLEWVDKGLEILDKGYQMDKKNIESLFIYGSTCYYLPFFLGKAELAEEKLREIIPLLDYNNVKNYDKDVIKGAMEFLLENLELTNEEKKTVNGILNKINA